MSAPTKSGGSRQELPGDAPEKHEWIGVDLADLGDQGPPRAMRSSATAMKSS